MKFRLVFYLLIGILSKKNNQYRITYLSFIQNELFNYPKKAHYNRFFIFSVFKQVIKSFLKKRNSHENKTFSNQATLITNSIDNLYFETYLKYKKERKSQFIICRNQLINDCNFISKINHLLFSVLYTIIIFPISLLNTKRVYFSSFLVSLIEFHNLYYILKKNKINHIYYFESFTNDSNILILMLEKMKISSTRIPSSNPLKNFYKYVVADEFLFTAPFHYEEFKFLKKTWIFNQIEAAPMLDFHEAIKVIAKKENKYIYDIGFLSSGSWLKKSQGINLLEKNSYNAEHELLNQIDKICIKNNLKLIVLMHPLEKKSFYENLVKEHYSQLKCKYELSSLDFKSYEYFNKINLCVTVSSSATFIRLFANLKSLFFPINIENKYLNTKINNISVYDKSLIEAKILNNIQLSEKDFFKSNNIIEYSHLYNKFNLDLLL